LAASKKVIESSSRLRYVRAMERFHKSLVSFLSSTAELGKEAYEKKIDAALKVFQRVDAVELYKGDLQDLENLIKKMISYRNSETQIAEIKTDILYRSNQLEKNKNARRYKKDKHSQSKYEDWE
jgi:RNA binding exosome subunit